MVRQVQAKKRGYQGFTSDIARRVIVDAMLKLPLEEGRRFHRVLIVRLPCSGLLLNQSGGAATRKIPHNPTLFKSMSAATEYPKSNPIKRLPCGVGA